MSFYEINDPYYAVIAAKNEEQCLAVYTEIISDVDDREIFFEGLKVLDKQAVIDELAKTFDEDQKSISREEAEQIVREADFENGEVILMDSSLI